MNLAGVTFCVYHVVKVNGRIIQCKEFVKWLYLKIQTVNLFLFFNFRCIIVACNFIVQKYLKKSPINKAKNTSINKKNITIVSAWNQHVLINICELSIINNTRFESAFQYLHARSITRRTREIAFGTTSSPFSTFDLWRPSPNGLISRIVCPSEKINNNVWTKKKITRGKSKSGGKRQKIIGNRMRYLPCFNNAVEAMNSVWVHENNGWILIGFLIIFNFRKYFIILLCVNNRNYIHVCKKNQIIISILYQILSQKILYAADLCSWRSILLEPSQLWIHNNFDIIQRDMHQHRLHQTIYERSHLRSTSI